MQYGTYWPVGRLPKARWTMDLLHNETWRAEFARRVLGLNIFNFFEFRPSV